MTARSALRYRSPAVVVASLAGVAAVAGCTPTEAARPGQACAALVQVLADGRQVGTQLQALGSVASASPNASGRQLLAGSLQEDVESAREVLAALPPSVASTPGPAASAGARALSAGDAAGAAVRTSSVPVALSSLARMSTAVRTARQRLRCS